MATFYLFYLALVTEINATFSAQLHCKINAIFPVLWQQKTCFIHSVEDRNIIPRPSVRQT